MFVLVKHNNDDTITCYKCFLNGCKTVHRIHIRNKQKCTFDEFCRIWKIGKLYIGGFSIFCKDLLYKSKRSFDCNGEISPVHKSLYIKICKCKNVMTLKKRIGAPFSSCNAKISFQVRYKKGLTLKWLDLNGKNDVTGNVNILKFKEFKINRRLERIRRKCTHVETFVSKIMEIIFRTNVSTYPII